MRDIFDFDFTDKEKAIIDKAVDLFDFPKFQFYLKVEGNSNLKNAILKHDALFYDDAIAKINSISSESTKIFERAKFQGIVFGESGISSDEVRDMCAGMDDNYYR